MHARVFVRDDTHRDDRAKAKRMTPQWMTGRAAEKRMTREGMTTRGEKDDWRGMTRRRGKKKKGKLAPKKKDDLRCWEGHI